MSVFGSHLHRSEPESSIEDIPNSSIPEDTQYGVDSSVAPKVFSQTTKDPHQVGNCFSNQYF